MNKVFGISLMALVFASCHNSGDRKSTTVAPSTPTTFTLPPAQGIDSNQPGAVNSTPATTNNAGTAALNPEHGAPGHRCDIPVGAPLSTPMGSTAAPTMNSNPQPLKIQPQAPSLPATNNVRLNPEHGAPGHDCNIPVGQPLRS